MKINRVMIAAPKSGSGKTVVTCALLQILKEDGWRVASCKCGPDYIDPLFHGTALGVPSKNLDTFFTGEEQTRQLFCGGTQGRNFAVLEGVMGLYDGLGGVREEGSSYHLAKVTKTPILLVVDAKGMGRSVIPLIAGFLAYDEAHLIRGILLNRISEAFYETIKPLLEKALKISVLGFLPEKEELRIESRHLGLMLPEETRDIRERLRTAAEALQRTVAVEEIVKIAEGAEELPDDAGQEMAGKRKDIGAVLHGEEPQTEESVRQKPETDAGDQPTIAVAWDEAFCFYYADNLALLEENGARLVYFSPLHDRELPAGCHALYLGGGYPELYAGQLGENSRMRAAVKKAIEGGMPVVAECGGFLYLHEILIDKEGVRHEMAGVLPAICFDTGKLVRFGYIELREKQSHFLPEGESVKGHEFHYYDSTGNGEDAIAVKPVTGREYSCMIDRERCFVGFPHLYYPSNPAFAERFVEKAERYRGELQNREDDEKAK